MRALLLGAIGALAATRLLAADLNCLNCPPDPAAQRYERDMNEYRAGQFFLAPSEPFRRLEPAVPTWGDTSYSPGLSDSERSRPITDPAAIPGGSMLLPLSRD